MEYHTEPPMAKPASTPSNRPVLVFSVRLAITAPKWEIMNREKMLVIKRLGPQGKCETCGNRLWVLEK
jgi:hypothetical protein